MDPLDGSLLVRLFVCLFVFFHVVISDRSTPCDCRISFSFDNLFVFIRKLICTIC